VAAAVASKLGSIEQQTPPRSNQERAARTATRADLVAMRADLLVGLAELGHSRADLGRIFGLSRQRADQLLRSPPPTGTEQLTRSVTYLRCGEVGEGAFGECQRGP
jgi:hypothetical protein